MNTSVFKSHFWVYWKAIRVVLFILFAVAAFNISLQFFIAGFTGGSLLENLPFFVILIIAFGNLSGLLIAIPIVEVTSLPYLLTFGSRRKDMVFSATTTNIIFAFFLSLIFTLLIGIYATNASEAPLYMGKVLTSWTDLIPVGVINMLLPLTLTNVIFLLGTVYYRWGILWGLGATALAISLPIFFMKEIYSFYVVGGSYLLIYLVLLSMILISLFLSNKILSQAEIYTDWLKIDLKGTIFLILALIIATSILYLGVTRFSS